MDISGTFNAANREEWRDWLTRHYRERSEIWW